MAHALRTAIGATLLLFQLVMIAHARRTTARYFCWAPFDMQTEYWISASLGGRPLSPAEIRARYRRPAHGVDNRSVQHVIDIIQEVEAAHPGDAVSVTMRYQINGKTPTEWTYQR